MGMYVGGNWYHLKAWEDVYEKKDVVGQLDVSILQEKVLTPILGIGDPRTDQRIRFVGGSHKLSELALRLQIRLVELHLPCFRRQWKI